MTRFFYLLKAQHPLSFNKSSPPSWNLPLPSQIEGFSSLGEPPTHTDTNTEHTHVAVLAICTYMCVCVCVSETKNL